MKKTMRVGLVVGIIVLIVASFLGYMYYENYQANRIYRVGDKISLPDLDLTVTKAEFKPVNLPIDEATIKKHGSLSKPEDCNLDSKEPTVIILGSLGNATYAPYGPSDYNICIRRNDSRKAIHDYSTSNKQLVVNYRLDTHSNVRTSNLKIALVADSGRKLDARVDAFNGNQFFKDGAEEKYDVGDGRTSYLTANAQAYIPYFQSNLGGDIDRGLGRSGYTYTDIRESEKNIDVKITYKKDGRSYERIVRIGR